MNTSSQSSAAVGIDLSQFYKAFFEEAGENLEKMEQRLLALDLSTAVDDEELNAIFRCAHSVKGGAATFGFADVAELTHQMETLLDRLRRRELAPTAAMVDLLLAAGDALRAQLARHQGQGDAAPDTRELLAAIRAQFGGAAPAAQPAMAPVAAPTPVPAVEPARDEPQAGAGAPRWLELTVGPLADVSRADDLVDLFKEIAGLGSIEPIDGGNPADGFRRFKVVTSSDDDELLDLFSFHVAREEVRLAPLGPGYGFHAGNPGVPPAPAAAAATEATNTAPAADPGYGFFDDAPGAPTPAPAAAPVQVQVQVATPPPASTAPARDAATLRVSIDKVDHLINLVGELVITQAALAEGSEGLDSALHGRLLASLTDLQRNTRDLQEAVMSIRMIPMSVVFSRFPRMLRDLAAKLGKSIELVTQGEATELDKGMVELITDPLTHLVRNSVDHGIEAAAERLARGKPEHGTVTLAASHQGGSIVIEVRDDGRGLSRSKLLAKARERGLDAPDSLSDAEVWGLILAPGFSTAEVVTDVSGRGVGLDVVKKNIASLGGSVEIDSAEGYGMVLRVRLPLTLAIMDGMSVRVGDECYILPLAAVVESFQLREGLIRSVGGSGRVVHSRDAYLPVVDLRRLFQVPRAATEGDNEILVVVEADGQRAALLVDELVGQQQIVVKNLEANYRQVDDVAGATILGSGRVALILDIATLVRRSPH